MTTMSNWQADRTRVGHPQLLTIQWKIRTSTTICPSTMRIRATSNRSLLLGTQHLKLRYRSLGHISTKPRTKLGTRTPTRHHGRKQELKLLLLLLIRQPASTRDMNPTLKQLLHTRSSSTNNISHTTSRSIMEVVHTTTLPPRDRHQETTMHHNRKRHLSPLGHYSFLP